MRPGKARAERPIPSLLSWYLRGALHDAHAEWLRGLGRRAALTWR